MLFWYIVAFDAVLLTSDDRNEPFRNFESNEPVASQNDLLF